MHARLCEQARARGVARVLFHLSIVPHSGSLSHTHFLRALSRLLRVVGGPLQLLVHVRVLGRSEEVVRREEFIFFILTWPEFTRG